MKKIKIGVFGTGRGFAIAKDFMIFNCEMKKVCDTGTLGKILYAEGEYNHPGDPNNIEFKKECNYYHAKR